jgi:hypothetical protein
MSGIWFAIAALAVVGVSAFFLGRKSRNGVVDRLSASIAHKDYQLDELKKLAVENVAAYRALQIDGQSNIQKIETSIAQCKARTQALEEELAELTRSRDELRKFSADVLDQLRYESATLPYAVRWLTRLQESIDEEAVKWLAAPPNPARSAALQVREAKAEARQHKQEANVLRNRIELYELQAPWLQEFAELTLEEVIEGLKEEESIQRPYVVGDDPVHLFLSATEWSTLSPSERNQLALDRYWEGSRRRTAWVAGTQYERFVGYEYESRGYDVEYHGALHGKQDLGIDLVCKLGKFTYIIQCKRLSPTKAIPVRENVVAQIYGAAMFYSMDRKIGREYVKAVIYTTYELSPQARQFAELLGVELHEGFEFKPYACIKCNLSVTTGERIYHLPFDQQYDRAVIGNADGEFYAMTVAEAEKKRFRRAHKWQGK